MSGSALAQSVMQKMADEWAVVFNSGDGAKLAKTFYTETAVVMPPGGDMVKGREAIAKSWTDTHKAVEFKGFKVTDVKALGPNGAREQGYAMARTKGDNPQDLVGKYVVVYEKVGGKWLLDSDIWNFNK